MCFLQHFIFLTILRTTFKLPHRNISVFDSAHHAQPHRKPCLSAPWSVMLHSFSSSFLPCWCMHRRVESHRRWAASIALCEDKKVSLPWRYLIYSKTFGVFLGNHVSAVMDVTAGIWLPDHTIFWLWIQYSIWFSCSFLGLIIVFRWKDTFRGTSTTNQNIQ